MDFELEEDILKFKNRKDLHSNREKKKSTLRRFRNDER